MPKWATCRGECSTTRLPAPTPPTRPLCRAGCAAHHCSGLGAEGMVPRQEGGGGGGWVGGGLSNQMDWPLLVPGSNRRSCPVLSINRIDTNHNHSSLSWRLPAASCASSRTTWARRTGGTLTPTPRRPTSTACAPPPSPFASSPRPVGWAGGGGQVGGGQALLGLARRAAAAAAAAAEPSRRRRDTFEHYQLTNSSSRVPAPQATTTLIH